MKTSQEVMQDISEAVQKCGGSFEILKENLTKSKEEL